jgi:hypothetical protein
MDERVGNGWGTLVKYAACASAIAFAGTTAQVWAAVLTCLPLMAEVLDG